MGGELEDFPLRYLAKLIQTERHHITCPAGPITALAVSDDGQRLASGHADGTVALWDLMTSQLLASVSAHDCAVGQIVFASGGKCLITIGARQTALGNTRGWNVAPDGRVELSDRMMGVFPPSSSCLAVAPDGQTIYAGSHLGSLHAINLTDSTQNRSSLTAGADPITSVVLGNADRELFVGTGGGKLLQYTLECS